MLLRHLLTFVVMTIFQAIASAVALLLAIAAGMSPGSDWLISPLLIIFFFPVLLLDWAGIEVVPIDSPQALLLNSPFWAAIIYPGWLAWRWAWRKYADRRTRHFLSVPALAAGYSEPSPRGRSSPSDPLQ